MTRHTNTRGFTLIETLVAVTILALAVAGPLYVADRALVATEIARDELTASYLAQEGIEHVHSMRDFNFLSAYHTNSSSATSAGWLGFMQGLGGGDITKCLNRTCTFDPWKTGGYSLALSICTGTGGISPCDPLVIYNGVYRQRDNLPSGQTGTPTPFTRTIQAKVLPGSGNACPAGLVNLCDLQITSTVYWSFHNTDYQVSVVDHLTPWQ